MHKRLTVLMVVAATTFAACGSDEDATSGTSNAATTEAETTDPPETDAPTTDVPTTDAPSTDSPTTEAATSTEAPVTEPPITAPPETRPPATEAPTTTAGEPVLNGLDPPCVESTAAALGDDETIADSFGPLEVEPTLAIELPLARSETLPAPQSAVAQSVPTESGLLLAVSAGAGEFPGSAISLIGWDEETRWTRCPQDNVIRWLAAPGATTALLQLTPSDDYAPAWYDVDVESGEITPTTLPLGPDRSLFASNGGVAVFGPQNIDEVDPSNAFLQIVDLEALTVEEVPLPEGVDPQSLNGSMFEFSPAGELVMVSRDSGLAVAIAVLRDGAWSTDPTVLDEAHGVQASFFYDDAGARLVGADASGTILWESEISPISAEGFQLAESDDVTVVAGCWEPLPEGELCNRSEVGGVDTATGAVLWRLENDRGVGVIGDGYAIVTDGEDGDWLMIETTTGEPVPDQEWDVQGLFFTGCCDDLWNTTNRFGGVVVATHDRDLQVFFPEE